MKPEKWTANFYRTTTREFCQIFSVDALGFKEITELIIDDEDQRDRARLIAAAPDLLEACEAMLDQLAERYTDDDFEKDVPLARAVEDMRAKVRKAKGESDDG